jgi:hypothetical protein
VTYLVLVTGDSSRLQTGSRYWEYPVKYAGVIGLYGALPAVIDFGFHSRSRKFPALQDQEDRNPDSVPAQ